MDAAAAAPNSPVAAAVAALVAQQQQQQSLAAQLAQQQTNQGLQQAQQQQHSLAAQLAQQQQQQAHSELAQLAAARAQLAQQQQAVEQQAALQQQQLAAQQQRRQEQQLQRQHSHTVGRPSPQRGSLALLPRAFSLPATSGLPASRLSPAVTTPNLSPDVSQLPTAAQLTGQLTAQRPASAAEGAVAAPAEGLQRPGTAAALQAVARGLSLSPPMSVGTPGVGPSDSTGSLAPGARSPALTKQHKPQLQGGTALQQGPL
jgi:hypothetical protein